MTRHISARTAELLAEIEAAHAEREQFPAHSDEYHSASDKIVDATMALLSQQIDPEGWRIECPHACDFVVTPRPTLAEAMGALREHEQNMHSGSHYVECWGCEASFTGASGVHVVNDLAQHWRDVHPGEWTPRAVRTMAALAYLDEVISDTTTERPMLGYTERDGRKVELGYAGKRTADLIETFSHLWRA